MTAIDTSGLNVSIEVQPGFCPLSSEDPSLFQRPCFVVLLLEKHNTAVRHHVGKAAHCIVSFCTVYPLSVAPHTHTRRQQERRRNKNKALAVRNDTPIGHPSLIIYNSNGAERDNRQSPPTPPTSSPHPPPRRIFMPEVAKN